VYAHVGAKKGMTAKQLLKEQKTFFTEDDGVSCCIKIWKMSVVFIQPGAKVNGVLL